MVWNRIFRVRLFWVKMILGNHFPPNPHVWLQRKMKFFGNSLPVDRNLRLWLGNEFTLSFSLQFISGKRERERGREKKESPDRRERGRRDFAGDRAARQSTSALVGRSHCSSIDALQSGLSLLSLSLSSIWALSSLSLSLSLFFRKWIEVKMRVKNHFRVKGENFGQQEAIFRKMKFTVAAKRLGLGENDFLKSLSPKTNASLIEFVWNKIAFIYYQTMGPITGLK